MDRYRVRRRLKLRDLHTLATVVRSGSMAKAAEALAVTQPAVSKTIAEMEELLGLRLLDRTPQGVAPTRYGEALSRRALALFDGVEQAVEELEQLADPTTGDVRVGCSEALLSGLMPVVIDRLTQRYPGLRFHVVQAPIAPLLECLRGRTIDVAVMRMPQEEQDDLEKGTLFDDPVSVVAGVKSVWATRSRISLRELADERWSLMPDDAVLGSYLVDVFQSQGLAYPRLGVKCTSLHMHLGLLTTGRYLSVLPASFLWFSSARSSLKVLPVKLQGRPPPVCYVLLRNRTVSPVVRLFIETLKTTARRPETSPSPR